MKALTFRHTLAPLVAVLAIGVSAPSGSSDIPLIMAICLSIVDYMLTNFDRSQNVFVF